MSAPQELDKEKALQDKINDDAIKISSLEKELTSVKDELSWLTEEYNNIVNATFSELFDVCAKVKNQNIYNITSRRNKTPPQ